MKLLPMRRTFGEDGYGFKTYLLDNGHFSDPVDGFSTVARSQSDVEQIDEDSDVYKDAVKSYQALRPLVEDGIDGPITIQYAIQEQGYRCGCPDIFEKRSLGVEERGLSEWPESCQIAVYTHPSLDSLTIQGGGGPSSNWGWRDAWNYALEQWNKVCGIKLLVGKSNDPKRIVSKVGRMSTSTLAWSYLPNQNCNETLKQEYNRNVTWNWNLLWTTICHEIGHAIGLPHGGKMMAPSYNPDTNALGPWDINQVVERYGKAPPVDPTLDVNAIDHGIFQFYNKIGDPIGTKKFEFVERIELPTV